jgi:hypothetical protein
MPVKVNDVLTVEDDTKNIIIKNVNQDKDIIFKVNDGGVDKEVLRFKSSTSQIIFPQKNDAINPTLAFSDNSGIYEEVDNVLVLSLNGSKRFAFNFPFFGGYFAGQGAINIGTGVPLVPNKSDSDSGVRWVSDNTVALVGGNIDGIQVDGTGKVFTPSLGILSGKADVQYDMITKELGYVSSSQRYKENILDIVNTDFSKNLTVKEYEYKGDDNTKHIGLIAEEVEQVYPQCVGYILLKDEDNSKIDIKYKNIKDYFDIAPHVVKSATLYYDEENEKGEVTEMSDTFDIIKKPDTVSYSSLVPILLDRIQKLEARVDILEAK